MIYETIIEVPKRPRKCSVCGCEVCDILYRMPGTFDEEAYYKKTGHRVLYSRPRPINGEAWPQYQCEFCGAMYRKA